MQGPPVRPVQEHPSLPQLEEVHVGPALDADEDAELAPDDDEDGQTIEHHAEDAPVNPFAREELPSSARVHRDPVLEISGTSSAAGKSQLLYYLAALAVLPSVFAGTSLGGHESAVVFIDTDGRFEADRLRTIARGIVHDRVHESAGHDADNAEGQPPTPDLESMLVSSLQHVHVFRPQSSSALLATLHYLDTYLCDLPRHFSSSRPLHSIFIDSAGAFFWQDKLHDEVARTEDIGRPLAEIESERAQKQSFYLADLYADLVTELKSLQRLFSCSVIYTTTAWSGRSMTGGAGAGHSAEQYGYRPSGPFELYNPLEERSSWPRGPAFRATLPPPWGLFPDLRLVVQRDRVRGFPASMTAGDAQGEQAVMRREVVMQGRFLVWVNGWGREDWPSRVREGLERRNGGVFGFCVQRDGVRFA